MRFERSVPLPPDPMDNAEYARPTNFMGYILQIGTVLFKNGELSIQQTD